MLPHGVHPMTKSQESGENEVTDEAKREAQRSGQHVCDVLADMLVQARTAGDTERVRKVIRAQEYLRCRNVRKRRPGR